MRSLRHSVRVVGLVVLALATTGGWSAGRAQAGPIAALVERSPSVESTAPTGRAARVAPRPVRPARGLTARPARWIDRAPRSSVARRAVPPRRAKSPTYVVHRALLR